MYGKGFLGNMTENLQADCVQSRQAGFIQCFLYNLRQYRTKIVRQMRRQIFRQMKQKAE